MSQERLTATQLTDYVSGTHKLDYLLKFTHTVSKQEIAFLDTSQVKKFFIPSKENVGVTHKNKDFVHEYVKD